MKTKQTLAALAAATLLSGLSGCGGSDYNNTANAPPATTPTNMVDAYFSVVASLVGSSLDTTEPQALDAVTVTAPENTEPVAPL